MWPTGHTHAAAAAEDYQAAKAAHEEIAQQYRVAAAQLAETSEGAFSEAAITEHQLLAIDHRNISEIMGHLHAAHQEVAILGHDLTRALDQIDYETHQEIATAPPQAREAIIAKGHAAALATLANFTTAVTDTHARVQGIVDPLAAGVIGRSGGPKTDDPTETTHALDNSTTGERGERTGSRGGRDSDTGTRGDLANRTPSGQSSETGQHGDLSTGTSPGGPAAESAKRGELTNPIQALPPLTSGVPSGLGGGSAPGGGGGIPAGGSGLGLGGANPLSAFTSGLGNVPSAAASQSGLPGMLAVRVVCPVFPRRVPVSILRRSLVVCRRALALLPRCRLWPRLQLCLGPRVRRRRLPGRRGRRHLRRRCRLVWLHPEHTRQLLRWRVLRAVLGLPRRRRRRRG